MPGEQTWDGETLVDLIYCPKGLPMDDDVIARELREQIEWPDVRAPSAPRVRVVTPLGSGATGAG
jgi:hypothetical protein